MARNDTRGGAVAEPEARRDTAAPARKDVLQRQRDEFGGFRGARTSSAGSSPSVSPRC